MNHWKYKTRAGRRSLPALENHIADISYSVAEQYYEYMARSVLYLLTLWIWT